MIDPAGHAEAIRPSVDSRHDDFAMKSDVARIVAKILRGHCQNTIQRFARLESLRDDAIKTRAAQVERFSFNGLGEAPAVQAQGAVQ